MKWVKASERLPDEGLVHFRTINGMNDVVFYGKKVGFYKPKSKRMENGKRDIQLIPLTYPIESIEWLDESDTKPFCIAFVRDLIKQYSNEEISFSRMVEILNERATGLSREELINIPVNNNPLPSPPKQ